MKKIILTYGAISGFVIIVSMILGMQLLQSDGGSDGFAMAEALGYLIMLVALSMIFVGIKRYRDRELGGVIRFGRALVVGLGISAVAGVVYVAVWEVNLAMTDYAFYEQWAEAEIEKKRASGATVEELAAYSEKMAGYADMGREPLKRIPITFLEIFPVGVLVSLVSAGILRNSKILPASA